MRGQSGFWDVEDRLKELSAEGDPLEKRGGSVCLNSWRLFPKWLSASVKPPTPLPAAGQSRPRLVSYRQVTNAGGRC